MRKVAKFIWNSVSNLSQVVRYCPAFHIIMLKDSNGAGAHYVIVSRIQWKPFWFATQLYPHNDRTGWQNGVNYDVFAQAPFNGWAKRNSRV